jgi:ubiquitin C-terminal hydrolase
MGFITFNNLGNTCYINSVLQCFIYNDFFKKYITGDLKKITELNLEDSSYNVNLVEFLNDFFKFNKSFRRFEQNDAHEFLINFLDNLTKIPGEKINTNEYFESFLKNNNYSPFAWGFHGTLRNSIKCSCCKSVSERYDIFNSINLNVPAFQKNVSVTSLFQDFLKKESNDDQNNLYYCDTCNSNQESEQKLHLSIIPQNLIISLKRYTAVGEKIISDVDIQETLNINGTSLSGVKKIFNYKLVSILNHFGNLYSGHYNTSVKSNSEWYNIDDNVVTKTTLKQHLSTAYILFYQMI